MEKESHLTMTIVEKYERSSKKIKFAQLRERKWEGKMCEVYSRISYCSMCIKPGCTILGKPDVHQPTWDNFLCTAV